jgi:antitoxin CcdA
VLEDDKRRPAKAAAAAASGSASGADVPPAEAAPVDLDRALDALMRARRGPGRKQNISVSIEADIVAAAAALGLDLSAEVERALTALARQRAADLWLAESREAIEEHNRFVERHGLWSDGFRQF